MVDRKGDSVFASRWEGGGLRLWTLVNRADKPYSGNLLTVPHTQGTRYFDLIAGAEAQAEVKKGVALLKGKIGARGIGGFLATPEKGITKDLGQFLQRQAEVFSRRDWDASFPERKQVHAFPEGRSPFGCYDMCGNTWQWTESERSNDGRTRFCFVRGGSFFRPRGSAWYTDGGPLPCNRAAKILLMWPGLDRCSTIGFRCVVDKSGG